MMLPLTPVEFENKLAELRYLAGQAQVTAVMSEYRKIHSEIALISKELTRSYRALAQYYPEAHAPRWSV